MKKIIKKIVLKIKYMYYINRYYKAKIKDNYVLIESKNSEDLASNMFYIVKELNKKEYSDLNVYISVKKNKVDKIVKLLKTYDINNYILVTSMSFKYLNILASAKYLFNDTSFPKIFIKKEGQVYTNTWHGTPLKCMSNDVPERRYAMGNVKRNFLMADYLIYPNSEMEEKMLSAYSINELFQGQIINGGYPRNSIFFDKKRASFIKEQLGLKNKQVLVYMPTWRGLMTKKDKVQQKDKLIEYFNEMDKKLKDDQILFVKLHVLVEQNLDLDDYKHIKVFPIGYETYDILNSADCLITDYSSVFFDFANTDKKIILFVYDKEEYFSTRGVYYNIDDFPFAQANNVEELIKEINNNKVKDYTNFKTKFCTFDNENATSSLLKYIIKGNKDKNITVKQTKKNNKKNVLIYTGSLAMNGITSSIISLINTIDLKKENIFLSFREKAVAKNPLKLERFSKDVDIFPLIDGFAYSFSEFFVYIMFYKFNIKNKYITNKLDNLFKRELKRYYGNAKFDYAIQFMGYEKRIIGLYQRFDIPKAIFVHSDMIQEMKGKGNQHKLTLIDAYKKYDKVVSVTEDIKSSIVEVSKKDENIVVVNNAIDYETIIEKSKKEIEFDSGTLSNVDVDTLNKILDKKNCTKFINVGRFSEEKGHKRLIDAFNIFYKQNKNSYLIIIGGYGKLWKWTNDYIKTLDCKYNVILIKSVSNPFSILKKCDLFILSSFYESLGLVLLESLICGVPVISTDINGPRGFMLEHKGRLVENSLEGILKGMNEFKDGKIKLINFDPKKYSNNVKKQYENIFK